MGNTIELNYGPQMLTLVEVEAAVERNLTLATWEGYVEFSCTQEVEDNQKLRRALSGLVERGFDRLMYGEHNRQLMGVKIVRLLKLSEEQQERYGPGTRCVVTLRYSSAQDWDKLRLDEIAPGSFALAGLEDDELPF